MHSARFVSVIAFVLALTGSLSCSQAAAPEAVIETEDQKTVYAMGYTLSKSLEQFALAPGELEVLIAGLRDGSAGKPARIDAEAYGPKIAEFGQARSVQAAQAEKAASSDFLAKEEAAAGAKKTSSGLIKRVVKEGSGPSPKLEDTVKVHYHGTLRDGSVFDSSVERGEPVEFPLNRVIPCWGEALQSMKIGEKAHITCPADIAYGDRGAPPKIKGGAVLAFDVELISIGKATAAPMQSPH
jgi:FKBP-type peptidyl-prolyl cis-trans isomerase FkpA